MGRKKDSPIKTLSLFSGAGGLDIGFHNAGFEIVACVEIEKAYCSTLIANRNVGDYYSRECDIHCADIREFDPTPYVGHEIECVIGGPPCQTFSAAGRRSGGVLGTNDLRGRLFETYCKILKVIKPRVFVFENVYGLPGANGGGPWREIVRAFSDLGYTLRADVLDAADYGVPQHRERLIIVGCRDEVESFEFPTPTHGPDSLSDAPLTSVFDAISDLQDPKEQSHEFDGLYGHLLSLVPEGLNYAFFTREMGYPKPYFAWRSKFHDFLYKVDRTAPSRTIKAQPGKFTGPFHWKNRHFTVGELKRLQTFPDDYQLVGSFGKVVEQIGNSVPPLLAQVIATSVKEQVLRPKSSLTYSVRPAGFRSTFRQRQRERTHKFKEVAKLEIAKRFPNVSVLSARQKSKRETHFVGYTGFFKKEIHPSMPASEIGCSSFSVEAVHARDAITLTILATPSSPKPIQLNIGITGLSKYLLTIDKVNVSATVASYDDVFKVWDIIQDRLVKSSQFFTLIDIYGHYANRGDTVKVITKIPSKKKSVLDKALEFFGSSIHAGMYHGRDEVAGAIGVAPNKLQELVLQLRAFRWDVRSQATHPTITTDEVICTYPFPLLSDRAQLERKLKSA